MDGNVDLFEYEWGQVSIVQMPHTYVQCDHAQKSCEAKDFEGLRGKFSLPVKTLKTIMKELGHDRVDLLKVDVEGSEYAFLEDAIDTSALGMSSFHIICSTGISSCHIICSTGIFVSYYLYYRYFFVSCYLYYLDHVQQVTLEWHHFAEDVRYGLGSSGSQNAIHTVLKALGLELFMVNSASGWDSADYMLNTRYPGGKFNYNLVSYIRVPKETAIP